MGMTFGINFVNCIRIIANPTGAPNIVGLYFRTTPMIAFIFSIAIRLGDLTRDGKQIFRYTGLT